MSLWFRVWGSWCSPSPLTVPFVEERGAGAALGMVEGKEMRAAGAALLCTQHAPAAPLGGQPEYA